MFRGRFAPAKAFDMYSPLRLIGCFTLLALLSLTTAPTPPKSLPANPGDAVSSLPPEVRLRKLHLVRPDLIPYPIAYEVCC